MVFLKISFDANYDYLDVGHKVYNDPQSLKP